MKLIPTQIILSLSLLAISAFCGCVKEDLSGCMFPVKLGYSFELNDTHTDLFADRIHSLDIYIFDSHGLLVSQLHPTSPSATGFPASYATTLNLSQGVYTAVAYGDLVDHTRVGSLKDINTPLGTMVTGQSTLAQLRLQLLTTEGMYNKEFSPLYHGLLSSFEVRDEGSLYRMPLVRLNHNIQVKVQGVEHLIPSGSKALEPLTASAKGLSGGYLHDNTFDKAMDSVLYRPFNQLFSDKLLVSDFSVLRLVQGEPLTYTLYHGSQKLWTLDLVAEIMKNPKYNTTQELDRHQHYLIQVNVGTAGSITITVNGWTTQTAGEIVG
ncbi:MAG: FimB/Mfa2 family fimbrial subunit [Mucinivorans sp.]